MPRPLATSHGGPPSVLGLLHRHLKRNKLTVLPVARKLAADAGCQDEGAAQDALERLVSAGHAERIEGRSAFARDAFVLPGHRPKPDAELGRLWFCYLAGDRRHLLSYGESNDLFVAEELEGPFRNLTHCVSKIDGVETLLRTYWCVAEKKNAREQLKNSIGKAARNFHHWISDGSYSVGVLVNTDSKKKEIEKLLSVSHAGRPPLAEQARFIVEVVPTVDSYPQFLKRLNG